MKITKQIPYQYKNAPIPGGGYVTGLIYHQTQPGILYARTDIGGSYRFDFSVHRWVSLIDHVTGEKLDEAFPIALALDDAHPNYLYIICGDDKKPEGTFCISEDYGEHFSYKRIPTFVHGNLSGRGTGYRLVVDHQDSDTLYYASQLGGLWKTTNRGDTWQRLPLTEDYTTFVWVSPDSNTIVVGTAGYTTRVNDSLRGHSLYVSYDAGESFEKLPMPENIIVEDSKMNGLTAARYDFDGTYLYVTLNVTGRFNFIVPLGYSCDTGDVIAGRVIRYHFKEGKIAGFCDITPEKDRLPANTCFDYGFGGISSCREQPGLLVCSTLCKEKIDAETIYISEDYGDTWRVSLNGLEAGGIHFRTSYMKPQYNGNISLLHWMSDLKLDPFCANTLWFNSGTGVFKTDALLSDTPAYHDWCDGIEETVHLNVYGPLSGDVQLVDIVGDLGGFAFRDLDTPCRNSFDDAEGNRYITCINADLSDTDSNLAIITARGNWKGKTKGGLIRTTDGFKTFERIPMPLDIGGKIADYLHRIENPNTNPGWAAMSADGKNIVWCIADNIRLPIDLVIVSCDSGQTFRPVSVYDIDGSPVTNGYLKVFSDRINNRLFYAFGGEGQLYVSTDGGLSFYQKEAPADFPKSDFGFIDCANATEVRGVAGIEGTFYLALGEEGLWKYCYDRHSDTIHCTKLSSDGDSCFCVGLGIGKNTKKYIDEPKTLYLCASIDHTYGFYLTLDEGKTYAKLNEPHQMFGKINSMDGDKNKFGRFFLATGSRGVLYGEMEETE